VDDTEEDDETSSESEDEEEGGGEAGEEGRKGQTLHCSSKPCLPLSVFFLNVY
jgi:hypothetical protein